MKPSLQLKIGHQLTMTPQLQQAIKLLQLSSLDLHQEIQGALYSNPMLELDEERPATECPETPNASELNGTKLNAEQDWSAIIPKELPVDADWDDIYQPSSHANKSPSKQNENSGSTDFELFHSVTESLADHLLWQLNLTPMSAVDKAIAEALIEAVDEDGMLQATPEEVLEMMGDDELELDEIIAVLRRIQQFDPPGVAARNLSECLQIQLRQLSPDTPHLQNALRLVRDFLPQAANRDHRFIERKSGLTAEQATAALALIQTLNPRPGEAVDSNPPEYVVPDARVTKEDGRWKVSLNSDITPKLSINQTYSSLVKRADSSDDNTFMRNNLQEARWFLRSLESRNETLMRVTTSIVELQQGFMDHGPEAMRPLVLADVAGKLGLHESTVSRATTQKFVDTPQGIFELKYFFSSHVSTSSGGECSSTAIRAILKKMIAAEDPKKPLSDNKLTALLQGQGIEIARRTVAKYREGMNIPSSSERKRFKQSM